MKQGTRCSLQSHEYKCETLYIDSGVIELEIVDKQGSSTFETFEKDDAYTIMPGTIHRVKVIEDCRLFEVSTPELDDVIRIMDDNYRKSGRIFSEHKT